MKKLVLTLIIVSTQYASAMNFELMDGLALQRRLQEQKAANNACVARLSAKADPALLRAFFEYVGNTDNAYAFKNEIKARLQEMPNRNLSEARELQRMINFIASTNLKPGTKEGLENFMKTYKTPESQTCINEEANYDVMVKFANERK